MWLPPGSLHWASWLGQVLCHICCPQVAWGHPHAGLSKVLLLRWPLQVWQVAEDLSQADVVLRLPGYSPMPAFKDVVDVPLVVRHARRSRDEVAASSCINSYGSIKPTTCSCV